MQTDEEDIIRYLLDELPEDQRLRIEEAMELDPSLHEIVAAVEDELILRYLREELVGSRHQQFEQCYLGSPSRRMRVEEARLLRVASRKIAASWREKGPRWLGPRLRWTLALTTAVAALILVFFAVKQRPLARTGGGSAEFDVPAVASFTLRPGQARAGPHQEITLLPDTKVVRLELVVDDIGSYRRFQCALSTPERPAIWSGEGVSVAHDRVRTDIPSSRLLPGDYVLRLGGINSVSEPEVLASYVFRVAR